MKKPTPKPTLLEIISKILDSDLPMSTRNETVRYYMLPKLGMTKAIIENPKVDVGVVERPSAEDIQLENNPKLKAGDKDFERLAGVEDEDEE